MPVTEEQIKEALKAVKYPGFSRDIVSFGLVKDVRIEGDAVTVQMALATNEPAIPQAIKTESEAILRALTGVGQARVLIDIHAPPTGAGAAGVGATRIEGIKHVIAIASGKGGVGKSTVAANLAVALEKTGARVGLCDCDIYGPSISLMFGSRDRPMATEENRIVPIEQYNLKLMSMGFLLDDAAPVIDARKAATMFEKVNVPVLGLIENMSYFACPSDGKRYDIFGSGGGLRESKRLRVPLLGQIPIDIATRESGDRGLPITAETDDSAVSAEFMKIAQELRKTLPSEAL
jgi:Mrp family chromosome partitioning ATPase